MSSITSFQSLFTYIKNSDADKILALFNNQPELLELIVTTDDFNSIFCALDDAKRKSAFFNCAFVAFIVNKRRDLSLSDDSDKSFFEKFGEPSELIKSVSDFFIIWNTINNNERKTYSLQVAGRLSFLITSLDILMGFLQEFLRDFPSPPDREPLIFDLFNKIVDALFGWIQTSDDSDKVMSLYHLLYELRIIQSDDTAKRDSDNSLAGSEASTGTPANSPMDDVVDNEKTKALATLIQSKLSDLPWNKETLMGLNRLPLQTASEVVFRVSLNKIIGEVGSTPEVVNLARFSSIPKLPESFWQAIVEARRTDCLDREVQTVLEDKKEDAHELEAFIQNLAMYLGEEQCFKSVYGDYPKKLHTKDKGLLKSVLRFRAKYCPQYSAQWFSSLKDLKACVEYTDLDTFRSVYSASVAKSCVNALEEKFGSQSSVTQETQETQDTQETHETTDPIDQINCILIPLILGREYPRELFRLVFEENLIAYFLKVFDSAKKLRCFETEFQYFMQNHRCNGNTWEDFVQHMSDAVKRDASLLERWNRIQPQVQIQDQLEQQIREQHTKCDQIIDEFQMKAHLPGFINWLKICVLGSQSSDLARPLEKQEPDFENWCKSVAYLNACSSDVAHLPAKSLVSALENKFDLDSAETQIMPNQIDDISDILIPLILEQQYPRELFKAIFIGDALGFFLRVFDTAEKLLSFQTKFRDFMQTHECNGNSWEDFVQYMSDAVKIDASLLKRWSRIQLQMQAPEKPAPEKPAPEKPAPEKPVMPERAEGAPSWFDPANSMSYLKEFSQSQNKGPDQDSAPISQRSFIHPAGP